MKEPQRTDGRLVVAGLVGLYFGTVFFLGLIASVPAIDLLLALALAIGCLLFLFSCLKLLLDKGHRTRWVLAGVLSGWLQVWLFPLIDDSLTTMIVANSIGALAAAGLLPWKSKETGVRRASH